MTPNDTAHAEAHVYEWYARGYWAKMEPSLPQVNCKP